MVGQGGHSSKTVTKYPHSHASLVVIGDGEK